MPITPAEAEERRKVNIPGFVIDVVNRLIVENVTPNGTATVLVSDIKAALHHGYRKEWLDFEELYREAGWEVTYDGPAYNETYPAYFKFRAKTR
jgi:hypothetical protein